MPSSKVAQEMKRRERQAAVAAYKLVLGGCVDCGSTEALHFDHREGTVKLFNPADVSTRSWAALFSEWAKCDVRCASCHTKRHRPRKPVQHHFCTAVGCGRPHLARGYCRLHYRLNVEQAS